jgi:tetratricopeptide (TPR) repeat protein
VADIFISYTSADCDWAKWIAKELEALGHTPHVHEWEIAGGGDIAAWMEERHHNADHILCVVSDAYLKAPYSSWERRAAQWTATTTRPNFALPVFIEACEAPTLLASIKRCDLHGLSEEEARTRLAAFMKPAAKPSGPLSFPGMKAEKHSAESASAPVAFPGKAYAISNIPIGVPLHFLGRDEELAAIDAALKRYEGRVAITALHGLRGVGKTTLAAAYAERHRGDYRVTWWVKAQTEPTMRADLVGLGVRLKWVAADEKHESALAAVMDRLRTEAEGVLLIYDNANDAAALRPYLPRGGTARVLVTSNAHAWRGTAEPVEIQLWPKEIGAEYLIARTGREHERGAAERLSIALGGLPLAHEQASAYCEWLDMPLEDYHARFEATPAKFLDDKRHAPAEYHDGLTVAKTFALAIDEAAKLHPAAEPLIVLAALLAPEPIPLYLFSESREKFGEPLASALEGDGLVEAVAALRAFALIDRETILDKSNQPATTDCIRLHRLVREVASAKIAVVQTRVDTVERLIRVLAAIYPDNGYSESKDWPRCSQLLPHGMFICREANVAGIEIGELPQLLDGLANYLNGIAAYREGEPLYRAALSLGKKIFGASHPKIGIWLNNLGNLLLNTARYSEAEPAYLEAIRIGEQGPEQNKVGIATRKNNLAILYTDVGQYGRAEALFSEAIASTRGVLGPRNRVVGTRLFNLANLYKRTGQSGKAEALYREAISIGEEVSGREDNRVSTWIAGLADVLRDTGRWEEAEGLYREAIANTQKIFSEGNPSLGGMRLEYSKLLLVSGHPDRALDEANLSLETKRRVYGDENPWTVNAARTTAQALEASGRANEARLLREKYGIRDE